MNKLIILSGISGSGKSTFASTTVRHNPNRMVDDRCQVVDYARSLGLKVFQVEYGNF